jgi:hypothetical protein
MREIQTHINTYSLRYLTSSINQKIYYYILKTNNEIKDEHHLAMLEQPHPFIDPNFDFVIGRLLMEILLLLNMSHIEKAS